MVGRSPGFSGVAPSPRVLPWPTFLPDPRMGQRSELSHQRGGNEERRHVLIRWMRRLSANLLDALRPHAAGADQVPTVFPRPGSHPSKSGEARHGPGAPPAGSSSSALPVSLCTGTPQCAASAPPEAQAIGPRDQCLDTPSAGLVLVADLASLILRQGEVAEATDLLLSAMSLTSFVASPHVGLDGVSPAAEQQAALVLLRDRACAAASNAAVVAARLRAVPDFILCSPQYAPVTHPGPARATPGKRRCLRPV